MSAEHEERPRDARFLASLIDHTLLKPDATACNIAKLCAEARQYGFVSVCVNSYWVSAAAAALAGTPVKVCAVVGFPLGAMATAAKAFEARECVSGGAREIDMVLNIGELRAGNLQAVRADIRAVVEEARIGGAIVKVILETSLLNETEKINACREAVAAGAAFVKTSTGFGGGGATAEDVALMRRIVGPKMGVKASGGIRTLADLERMIAAGANRIGASAGVQIVEELAGLKPAGEPGY